MFYKLRCLAIAALIFNVATGYCLAEDNDKTVEEPVLTPQQIFLASLKEDMVIGYFNQYWQPVNQSIVHGYYRRIVKILDDNRFVVQDFFVDSGKKQSDPFIIANSYELKQAGVLRSIEGPYIAWYENDQKQYQLNYIQQGILDGEIRGWYQNGQMKLKGLYRQGKKTGSWVEWYESGKVKSKVYYVNNKLDGVYKQWHENGQIAVSGIYAKGILEGIWIAWNSKGEKLSEGIYKANKRIGLWTYYVAGKKWAEGNYVNGLQDGIWIYWTQDGTKEREILYQNGQEIKKDSN